MRILFISFLLCFLSGYSGHAAAQDKEQTTDAAPAVVEQKNLPVSLAGRWYLLWGELAEPKSMVDQLEQAIPFNSPKDWNDVLENDGVNHGIATLATAVDVAAGTESELGLFVSRINEAYRVWSVNKQTGAVTFQGGAGIVSADANTHLPARDQQALPLDLPPGRYWLIFQVSKHNYFRGGTISTIEIGNISSQKTTISRDKFLNGAFIGAAFLIGLYYLAFFIQNPRELSAIILMFFCLGAAFRVYMASGLFTELLEEPDNSLFILRTRLEYLTVIITAPFTIAYYQSISAKRVPFNFTYWSFAVTAALTVIIFLLPTAQLRTLLPVLQAWLLINLSIFSYLLVTIDATSNARLKILKLASSILVISISHDVYAALTPSYNHYVLGYGIILFLFIQSIYQAQHFAMTNNANAVLQDKNKKLTKATLEARRRAEMDGLTGVYNRRGLDRLMKEAGEQCIKQELPLSIILIDIDHFKKFNDDHGHLVGDEALKFVAATLKKADIREQDHFGRWGGEEFLLILPGTPLGGALKVADKLRRGVENTAFVSAADTLKLTISIGVSTAMPDHDQASDISHLFEKADEALYLAKANGRNAIATA